MDDREHRLENLEADLRNLRHRVESLSEKVGQAQRAADIAIEKMEESMSADVAEAKRIDLQFNAQNKELATQTKMLEETRSKLTVLADAEQRRALESMRIKAVNEAEEKREKQRKERMDRLLKYWPIVVPTITALTWLAATVVAHWR